MEYYERMHMDLKDVEVQHRTEKENLESQVERLRQRLAEEEKSRVQMGEQMRTVEAYYEEQMKESSRKQRAKGEEWEELQSRVEQLQQERRELEEEVLSWRRKEGGRAQEAQRLKNDLDDQQAQLDEYLRLLEKRKDEIGELQQDNDNLRRHIHDLNQAAAEHDAQHKYLAEQIRILAKDKELLLSDNDRLKSEIKAMDQGMDDKNQELTRKIAELDQIKHKYEAQFKSVQSSAMAGSQVKRVSPSSPYPQDVRQAEHPPAAPQARRGDPGPQPQDLPERLLSQRIRKPSSLLFLVPGKSLVSPDSFYIYVNFRNSFNLLFFKN